jgi:hypothetical protein
LNRLGARRDRQPGAKENSETSSRGRAEWAGEQICVRDAQVTVQTVLTIRYCKSAVSGRKKSELLVLEPSPAILARGWEYNNDIRDRFPMALFALSPVDIV